MRGKMKKLSWLVLLLLMTVLSVHGVHAQSDTIELNSLAQYYEPVIFDHALHVDMLGDESCANCHHHTVGTPLVDENCRRCHEDGSEADTVNCEDCHAANRFSAEYLTRIEKNIHLFHEDKPGLKGAFHQKCMGCHEKMDAPIGCEDCHTRTDAGDKLYRSGKYKPEPSAPHAEH